MGVVNVTPDSFSDGGLFLDPERAVAHGRALLDEGADILDVGGESTRPGAEPVPAAVEVERTAPVVAELAAAGAVVSIDTSKAEVASAALDAGSTIVNDVTALRGDPELAPAVRRARVRGGPDAHARQPAHDAGCPRLRRRGRGGARLPRRPDRRRDRRRDRRAPDLDRSRDRVRKDRRPQPRAAAPARRAVRARLPGCRRHLAQALPRRSDRPRGRRTARGERSPPPCWRWPRVPRCCASTTCSRPVERWTSPRRSSGAGAGIALRRRERLGSTCSTTQPEVRRWSEFVGEPYGEGARSSGSRCSRSRQWRLRSAWSPSREPTTSTG